MNLVAQLRNRRALLLVCALPLDACVGIGAVVTDKHESTTAMNQKEWCLSGPEYDSQVQGKKRVSTKITDNREVQVFKSGGLPFRGLLIGAVLPIPIGIPFLNRTKVIWEDGLCTYSRNGSKVVGWYVPYH